jgi:endonuclease/exonuclease/phosphatase family metal-dependent hydrolase
VELLAAGLAALDPDVVALQEAFVASDGSADTAAYLAQRLGLQARVAHARRKPRTVQGRTVLSDSNVVLLSREAPLESEAWPLPSHSDDGERVALLIRVSPTLVIANVHLTHLRGMDALRSTQIATVLAHRWFATADATVAHLVMGDLNTDLAQLPALFADDSGWSVLDTFGAAPRATVPVTAAPGQGRCLDYILSLRRESRPHPTFDSARIVLDQPDASGVYPSDHRGVMVSLDVQ